MKRLQGTPYSWTCSILGLPRFFVYKDGSTLPYSTFITMATDWFLASVQRSENSWRDSEAGQARWRYLGAPISLFTFYQRPRRPPALRAVEWSWGSYFHSRAVLIKRFNLNEYYSAGRFTCWRVISESYVPRGAGGGGGEKRTNPGVFPI